MDKKMPIMDGFIATQLIREMDSNVPIIAQTAYAEEREKVKECGFSDFISKPFQKHELVSTINKFFHG